MIKLFYHKKVVIDSSVLLKAFLNEEGSESVSELLSMNKKYECTLMAPTLLQFEFMNILSRLITDPKKLKNAQNLFDSIGIALLNLDKEMILEAAQRGKGQTSYYDSSFHSLAKAMDATFLTADEKYFKKHEKEGNIALFSC